MKKIICLVLSIVLLASLVACKNEKDTSSNTSQNTSITQSDDTNSTYNQTSENNSSNASDTTSTETTSSTTSKPTESSKPTQTKPADTLSNPNSSTSQTNTSKPTHTHNYSNATCTEPKKCFCGATDGQALGHKWINATCKAPKTCEVCKATEGNFGTHIIENGLCKFCSQPIIISPKNLDVTKTYVHITEVDDFEAGYVFTDVISVDSIGFSEFLHIGNQGLFSSNKYDWTNLDEKINYNGKDYYHIGIGGEGIEIVYEITEKEIIIRDKYEPTEHAILNLLSDGSVKVVSKTNNFKGNWETQIGWIYKPTQTYF